MESSSPRITQAGLVRGLAVLEETRNGSREEARIEDAFLDQDRSTVTGTARTSGTPIQETIDVLEKRGLIGRDDPMVRAHEDLKSTDREGAGEKHHETMAKDSIAMACKNSRSTRTRFALAAAAEGPAERRAEIVEGFMRESGEPQDRKVEMAAASLHFARSQEERARGRHETARGSDMDR